MKLFLRKINLTCIKFIQLIQLKLVIFCHTGKRKKILEETYKNRKKNNFLFSLIKMHWKTSIIN